MRGKDSGIDAHVGSCNRLGAVEQQIATSMVAVVAMAARIGDKGGNCCHRLGILSLVIHFEQLAEKPTAARVIDPLGTTL